MLLEQRKFRKPLAKVILWLALCAVLFSQYLGFAHRMSHFSTYGGDVLSVSFDDQGKLELRKLSDTEAQIHSCLLFDGSTIFDAVQHSLSWDFEATSFPREQSLGLIFSIKLPAQFSFQSRAPPL